MAVTVDPATLTLLLAALAIVSLSALLVAIWRAETRSRQDDAAWSEQRACIARMFLLPYDAPTGKSDAQTWSVVE